VEEPKLPKFDYYLDESDPDIFILRRLWEVRSPLDFVTFVVTLGRPSSCTNEESQRGRRLTRS